MNLDSKQTFKVLEFVLKRVEFKQVEIHKETGVSLGRVNEIVQWLRKKDFVRVDGNHFVLFDPVGLLSSMALFRDMNSLLVLKLPLRVSKKKLLEELPKQCTLCLDSALQVYSKYWRSPGIQVYADDKTAKLVSAKLKKFAGGNNLLFVYRIDHALGGPGKRGFRLTNEVRTVIDLACDKKLFYAKELISKLWGVSLEE